MNESDFHGTQFGNPLSLFLAPLWKSLPSPFLFLRLSLPLVFLLLTSTLLPSCLSTPLQCMGKGPRCLCTPPSRSLHHWSWD